MNMARQLARGLWGLLCLLMSGLLLLTGLVLAAVLLARSPTGEAWLTSMAQQALSAVVPDIRFSTLRGPLPERLEVDGLSLHDSQGEWLSVERLSLVINWRALLDRRVEITELAARSPHLQRLPVTAEPAGDAPPSPPLTSRLLTSWLDLLPPECPPVRVENLRVEQGAVDAGVLAGAALLKAIDITGSAVLQVPTPSDQALQTGLEATLKAEARLEPASETLGSELHEGLALLPAFADLRFSGTTALWKGGQASANGQLDVVGPKDAGSERLELTVAVAAKTSEVSFPEDPAPDAGLAAQFALQTRLPAALLNAFVPPAGVSSLVSGPLTLSVSGHGTLDSAGKPAASGKATSEGSFLGESLNLSLDWQADLRALAVKTLRVAGLGLALDGQGDLVWPAQPEGKLRLAVSDWATLGRALERLGVPARYLPLLTARQAEADLSLKASATPDLQLALRVDGWDERVAPFRLEGSLRLPEGGVRLRTGLELPLAVLRRIPELTSLAGLPDGQVKASLTMGGRLARPEADLRLTVDGVSLPELPLPAVGLEMTARLRPPAGTGSGTLSVQGTVSGIGTMPARLEARLGLPFDSGGPQFSEKALLAAPLSGVLSWNGPLADWWKLVPVSGQRLRGEGRVRLEAKGPLAAPQLEGEIALHKASWDDQSLGLAIAPINATVLWQGQEARLTLDAGDGRKGSLVASGLVGGPATGFALNVQGRLARFAPLRRNDVRAVFSGTLDLAGTALQPDVRAAITVNEGDVRLARLPGASVPELPVTEKNTAAQAPLSGAQQTTAAPGTLDVNVTVPGRFFVRGHGLDSEWKGQLAVRGPLVKPRVTGEIASQQGTLELLGKIFTLAVGRITLDGQEPPNPALDILLRYTAPAVVAEASVTGSVARPRLTLSSAPPLPQDEVVSQILFGTGASSLTRAQAVQLAASVASLAGMGDGGLGLFDLTRKVLGVDVLRVGNGSRSTQRHGSDRLGLVRDTRSGADTEANTGSLEAGKYLSDKVYVGVEQGLGADSGAVRVEVDLAPNITLEARTSSKASDIGINWKKDY